MITGGLCRAAQVFVFHSEGYPAQVELESGDLPLGESRSIRRIAWDADVPAGTRIAVETQTGNGFQTVKRYYLKNGKEVADLRAYESQKSRNQGPIVEEEVRDESWTSWSEPRRTSGQAFSSPSPRRWLRVRVRLISDDPEAMPTLRSLTFVASDPVISAGLSGGILPREAALDSLQEFLFTIRPVGFSARDPGFDQVVIALPAGSAGAEFAGVTVRGREIDAQAEVRNDSLVVQLPPPAVRRDSVEIRFRTRLYQSPSVFSTVVGNSGDRAQERTHRCVVCYAESDDGLHFDKPDLGLFSYNGIGRTNIVLVGCGGYSDRYANSVVVDTRDSDPGRRYKMAYYDFESSAGEQRPGVCVAFSADGIHWRKHTSRRSRLAPTFPSGVLPETQRRRQLR